MQAWNTSDEKYGGKINVTLANKKDEDVPATSHSDYTFLSSHKRSMLIL